MSAVHTCVPNLASTLYTHPLPFIVNRCLRNILGTFEPPYVYQRSAAGDKPVKTVNMAAKPLQFATFTSEIELPFYSALFGSKLDHDKLDDSARSVLGLYEPRLEDPESSCRMQILGNALTSSR